VRHQFGEKGYSRIEAYRALWMAGSDSVGLRTCLCSTLLFDLMVSGKRLPISLARNFPEATMPAGTSAKVNRFPKARRNCSQEVICVDAQSPICMRDAASEPRNENLVCGVRSRGNGKGLRLCMIQRFANPLLPPDGSSALHGYLRLPLRRPNSLPGF
jgi:hypothetical protein